MLAGNTQTGLSRGAPYPLLFDKIPPKPPPKAPDTVPPKPPPKAPSRDDDQRIPPKPPPKAPSQA